MRVTLAVCTRERPVELARLFASLGRSRFRAIEPPDIDVVVVDNAPGVSPDDPAILAEHCPWPVRVVAEPRTGVAFARNTAIAHRAPDADWFVSVDDDQVVAPSWLDQLLAHAAASEADIVTGPVLVRIPARASGLAREMWKNVPRHDTGTRLPSYLGGNVCFRTSVFDSTDERYDETQALSTADDADLGRRLTRAGFVVEWVDTAICWEHVPDARLKTRWFIERYLSFGGFEYRDARRSGGLAALVRGSGHQAVRAMSGLGHVACGLLPALNPDRRDRHRAAAIAHLSTAAGWFVAISGKRVADYRRITTESPVAAVPADLYEVRSARR